MDSRKTANSDPIDSIRRDSKDGAYHCPQCNTPFTRRSNLRRHYQIHMRSMLVKCENCSDEYYSTEELQAHLATCFPASWGNSNALQSMSNSFLAGMAPGNEGRAMSPHHKTTRQSLSGDFGTSSSAFSDFESLGTRNMGNFQGSVLNHALSSLSSSGSIHSPTPSFDGSMAMAAVSTTGSSHRRPSTSSSSVSSSSTSSAPYTPSIGNSHENNFYSCLDNTSNFDHWNSFPSSPVEGEPVYTRRQVKDMIDVMSECLIETMETVITRGQPTPLTSIHLETVNNPRRAVQPPAKETELRQAILSEAIPRLSYKMQSSGTVPRLPNPAEFYTRVQSP
ncbi:hypothetical protein CVT24_011930 [Panaeolus cyanescens]|uniref:C2H2-type domain-containing protein n=1 Tax=Panaeolus cyanescens TaxID=181874 RepID=A0A409VXM1_9AGAR|nr:hypothetical protein CVT24_011930 [Panaeolus cyanescens]